MPFWPEPIVTVGSILDNDVYQQFTCVHLTVQPSPSCPCDSDIPRYFSRNNAPPSRGYIVRALCTMPLPAMHCPQATGGRTPGCVVQTANVQQCHTQLGACFETTVSRLEPKLVPPGTVCMVIVQRCVMRTDHRIMLRIRQELLHAKGKVTLITPRFSLSPEPLIPRCEMQ